MRTQEFLSNIKCIHCNEEVCCEVKLRFFICSNCNESNNINIVDKKYFEYLNNINGIILEEQYKIKLTVFLFCESECIRLFHQKYFCQLWEIISIQNTIKKI